MQKYINKNKKLQRSLYNQQIDATRYFLGISRKIIIEWIEHE